MKASDEGMGGVGKDTEEKGSESQAIHEPPTAANGIGEQGHARRESKHGRARPCET